MKLSIILVGEDSLALASLKQQLEKEPSVTVEPKIYGYNEALDAFKSRSGPLVAVIDINLDPERAFNVAEQVKLRFANVRLVMTSPTGAPDTILRVMRSGAEEFLPQPFNWNEVLKSFDTIRKKVDVHSTKTVERGHIIAISSNKGGVGSTTAAANLAACLVAQNKSVCLVDLVCSSVP